MILNHMDASIQKCRDLKRSCIPAVPEMDGRPVSKCDHYRVRATRSCQKTNCHWSKKILLGDCPTVL